MSKIIKDSVWGDPVVIEAPPPPPPSEEKPGAEKRDSEEEKLSPEETMGLVAALQHKKQTLEAEIAASFLMICPEVFRKKILRVFLNRTSKRSL